MKKFGLLIVATLGLLSLSAKTEAYASMAAGSAEATENAEASQVIKKFYTQLITVMKSGDKLGYAGRFKKLMPAIKSSFNLPLMTRLAVGSAWNSATPEQRARLVSAFSDFSVANYAHNFVQYNGEQFAVLDEKPVEDAILVETQLTPKDDKPVMLNYLMRRDENGQYRITDVFLGGAISELATRREEFSTIAKREGISALVNSLSAKSKQMGPS